MKRKTAKPMVLIIVLLFVLSTALTACSDSGATQVSSGSAAADDQTSDPATGTASGAKLKPAPEIPGLTLESAMEKEYATEFDVFYYSEGYKVFSVSDGRQYLLVPEGKEVPAGVESNLSVLQAPLDNVYLTATSVMSLIIAVDALDHITMTGTNASGWYIEKAAEAVESGKILYAGKYSEPYYEMLVEKDCDLSIQSTMILHAPKVQEMLERMDIPVFIDRASYEGHPLGRTEWIKLYGAMFDQEKTAQAVFDERSQIVKDIEDFPNTEKTVAYFNIKTDGTAQIRNPKDYIATMIEIGGARYVFHDINLEVDTGSTINISMEEFYATAVDADYLIYNATIAAPIETTDDLLALSELFADFKAVKNGNVWCGGNNLYQATDMVGYFILDVRNMVTGASEENMTFLKKVR